MSSYVECRARAPLPGPACQREAGHEGPHQAVDEDAVLSTWAGWPSAGEGAYELADRALEWSRMAVRDELARLYEIERAWRRPTQDKEK